MNVPDTKTDYAYRRLARKIESQIEAGIFRAADRLPSIRKICRQERVSPGTVAQALALLEAAGSVVAKPRSGYYVRPLRRDSGTIPEPAFRKPEPTAVGVSDLVATVFCAARDKDLVQLGAALPSPDLLPTEKLSRFLAASARREAKQIGVYGVSSGHEELVRQLIIRMASSGCTVRPEEITVTVGAMEALNLAVRAVARPGDIVAVESPCYFGILEVLESRGVRALPIPSSCDTGIDLTLLNQALEDHPVKALMLVSTFSNPNGSCMTEERRKRLMAILEDYDVPLIEDDVYGDLYFGPERPRPVKALDTSGLVIYSGSFSKSLAPGMRIGWVAGGRFAERVQRLKFISSVATSSILQDALASFLKTGGMERHLRNLRQAYRLQVTRTREAIIDQFPEGTTVSLPQGASYLWVRLPSGVDALELHRRALADGITIAPGPIFSPHGDFRDCIRISCGNPWSDQIESAIATLGRLTGALLRDSLRRTVGVE